MAKKRKTKSWDPFTRPIPTWECLTHPALLVQAWKKTHGYLRTKSWFADVLELDLSAVDLKQYIDSLRVDIRQGPEHFSPSPMRLVPAPKSDMHPWEFAGNAWRPGENTKRFMRPLAHLALRDQVLATAILICLSDCVESAQGDSELSTQDARKAGVASYGNRLLCDWVNGEATPPTAQFTWGNAALYRKYYVDYRAFLKRPIDVCRQHQSLESGETELGVVSLDLQGFYDVISPDDSVAALQEISSEAANPKDDRFWQAVVHCFDWNWDESDTRHKALLKAESLPAGLPQGLVAAGFFSNAYMVAFDRYLTRRIKRSKPRVGKTWRIVDYCRYVDDIRLVVHGPPTANGGNVTELCSEWMRKQLDNNIDGQQVNDGKSAFTTHEELESRTLRPTLMAAIQDKLSGPIDLESLEEAGNAIDSLLNTVGDADNAKVDEAPTATDEPTLALAKVHVARHSVRDDTVARFAAYRKLTSLRDRRFLQAAESSGRRPTALRRVDAEIEASARRMVRMWSRDPSLVIVLRHALNLFPTPELVEPVIETIQSAIKQAAVKKRSALAPRFCRAVGLYVAGELFKAGVIETGIDTSHEKLSEKADLDGYRESLADFAEELLSSPKTPWYVARQAVMFVLSAGRIPLACEKVTETLGDDYLALIEVAKGDIAGKDENTTRIVPLLLVLDQLRGNRKKTITQLRKLSVALAPGDEECFAERLYLANPEIASELRHHLNSKRSTGKKYSGLIALLPYEEANGQHSTTDLDKKATLAQVMGACDNPFVQETAALQLLKILTEGLLQGKINIEQLQPARLSLAIETTWSSLTNPRLKHTLTSEKNSDEGNDRRYENPTWATGDRGRLYSLGRIVRAAVLGNFDFTSAGFELSQCRDGYCGLRSSWYKRQHGMSTSLSTSEWDTTSCSPWFASLIAHLLSWPGSRIDPEGEFTHLSTPRDLLRTVKKRLATLTKMYGRSSDMPVYDCELRLPFESSPTLSMALIQTVRPTREDFVTHGPELSGHVVRPAHRGHLASMLRLAHKQLTLRPTYGKKAAVDLVVLPELGVHRDDLDLVERFIDATQAIVFCGLVFFEDTKRGGLVNSGMWLIPEHRKSGRSFRRLLQGKHHLTDEEEKLGVLSHRPHQYVLKVISAEHRKPFVISGSICFDATDLSFAADLRDQTDMLIVAANNRDVPTFDTMAAALSWHMFQHIVIVNSGEFGGSVVSAPYKERHQRVLKHDHGGFQAAVSVVEIDLCDYQRMRESTPKELKSPPAGFLRH